jgi:hypothetical protein
MHAWTEPGDPGSLRSRAHTNALRNPPGGPGHVHHVDLGSTALARARAGRRCRAHLCDYGLSFAYSPDGSVVDPRRPGSEVALVVLAPPGEKRVLVNLLHREPVSPETELHQPHIATDRRHRRPARLSTQGAGRRTSRIHKAATTQHQTGSLPSCTAGSYWPIRPARKRRAAPAHFRRLIAALPPVATTTGQFTFRAAVPESPPCAVLPGRGAPWTPRPVDRSRPCRRG